MASIIAKFLGDGKDFNKTVAGVQGKMNGLKKVFGAFSALLGVGAIVRFTNEMLEMADRLDKTAKKLGVTTDFLQEWNFMAGRAGVAATTAEMALQRFTRRVGDAQKGFGEFLPVAREYNIQLFDSEGAARNAEEVFLDLADAVQGMSSAGEKVSVTFKAMDSEGVGMKNTLDLGSEGIKRMREEAHSLNNVMSDEAIERLSKYSDGVSDIQGASKVAGGELLSIIGGGVEDLGAFYLDQLKKFDSKVSELNSALEELVGIAPSDEDRAASMLAAADMLLEKKKEQVDVVKKLTDQEIAQANEERLILETNEKIKDILMQSADTLVDKILPAKEKLEKLERQIAEQAEIAADEGKTSEDRLAATKRIADLHSQILATNIDLDKINLAEKAKKEVALKKELAAAFDDIDQKSEDLADKEAKRTAELEKQKTALEGQQTSLLEQLGTLQKQSADFVRVGQFRSSFQDIASGRIGGSLAQRDLEHVERKQQQAQQALFRFGEDSDQFRSASKFALKAQDSFEKNTGVKFQDDNPFKEALEKTEKAVESMDKKFDAL